MNRIVIWSLLAWVTISCREDHDDISPFPDGTFSSIAAFNANLSSSDPFADYATEYKAIFDAGTKGAQTAAPWGSLNPNASSYDLAPITNPYFGIDALVSYGYQTIFLNVPVITIDKRSMPSDILSKSFDDPAVISRLKALIDGIIDQLDPQVKYISLGNEVDTYFATHPGEWDSYQILIEEARLYLKSFKPGISVGVTLTFEGATSTFVNEVKQLTSSMDVMILTYYPIDNKTFVPRSPATVSGDIAKMLEITPGRQVVLQEWGYPSSSALGSSEREQAEFYYNSFVELEKQGPSKFPFVSFFKFRDWNQNHVQATTGQNAGHPFYEFMNTLGLKKNDGSSKEAFVVVSSWLK